MSYLHEYVWESELFYSHLQEEKLTGGNKASENQAWIASFPNAGIENSHWFNSWIVITIYLS